MSHRRSLSNQSNNDLMSKYSTFTNSQTTPRSQPYHKITDKMTSTSLLLNKFKPHNQDASQMTQSTVTQTSTVRKEKTENTQQDNQFFQSTVKKTEAKQHKPQQATAEIHKEQTETIDRLLSYNKVKEKRLKALTAVQTQKEIDNSQKIVVSKATDKILAKSYKKQIQAIPQEDPLWSSYQQRDKQVQVDFGDEKLFKDVIKQFKIKKAKQNPKDKNKIQHDINQTTNNDKEVGHDDKEIQTNKSYLQKQLLSHQEPITCSEKEELPQQTKNDNEIDKQDQDGNNINQHDEHLEQFNDNQSTHELNNNGNADQVNQSQVLKSGRKIEHKNDTTKITNLTIQDRMKFDEFKKKKWLEQQKESAKQKEDLSIKQITRKETSESEVLKDFLSNQDRWVAKKNEFVQKQRVQKNQDGLEGLTFMPKLNENSIKLANKNKSKKSTEDRLIDYTQFKKQKIELLQEIQAPVFHPTISPKSKMKQSEYKQDNYSICSKIQVVDFDESFQD